MCWFRRCLSHGPSMLNVVITYQKLVSALRIDCGISLTIILSPGYFVALFACFWPALVKSIVLINSAGDIIPGYTYQLFNKVRERSTSGVAWLGARLLLSFLRLNLKSIVRNCYPTKSERADDWLMDEMLRASYDPGVLIVLESIFSFDLSLPLNYLLEGFEQKVLIIQGMKDPISNSQTKVAMLKEHCAGVMVREVNAGHCPHDEQPEVVNSLICEWLVTVESKVMAGSVF
ncbi:hypothetical protein Tsubulata_022863 [Turnera subulata]|uniref:AB hydrolase-1 domain-containing protein n=1 Tax=Turnera subulata TaxID=218843 RepID=A0A9Q0FDN0_9ROSI|nr:hypothetical protein Tsubulata_022863 [Turnera subulata]